MRLLTWDGVNDIKLTRVLDEDERPPYAILSHTWAKNNDDELLHDEVDTSIGRNKPGYEKILFCARQARKDGYNHFWVDTCCIDKRNNTELSEAIISMFRWYQKSAVCYAYLADVSVSEQDVNCTDPKATWETQFRQSLWFTRGWTLQELLAPQEVVFFSSQGTLLGTKKSLTQQISEVTSIPAPALSNDCSLNFSVKHRLKWIEHRKTKKAEDKAYCLLGLFGVSMSILYGEGEHRAFQRLRMEIEAQHGMNHDLTTVKGPAVKNMAEIKRAARRWIGAPLPNPMFRGREQSLDSLSQNVKQMLSDRSDGRPSGGLIVISGLPGQGKSELCLQLAHRMQDKFSIIMWVNGSTEEKLETGLVNVAHKLQQPARDRSQACESIDSLTESWLLVLDNADNPGVQYQRYLPRNRSGITLISTCILQPTQNDGLQIVLAALDIEPATSLLLHALSQDDGLRFETLAQARIVVQSLSQHPLAIIQAALYMQEGGCSLEDWCQDPRKHVRRMLRDGSLQGILRDKDLKTTFELTMTTAEQVQRHTWTYAVQCLSLLAWCHSQIMPTTLFDLARRAYCGLSKHRDNFPKDCDVVELVLGDTKHVSFFANDGQVLDDYALTRGLSHLASFSLITIREKSTKAVEICPLVQAWARERQNARQQCESWLQMATILVLALSCENISMEEQHRLVPHARELLHHLEPSTFVALPGDLATKLVLRLGWFLWQQGEYSGMPKFVDDLTKDHHVSEQLLYGWKGLYEFKASGLLSESKYGEAIPLLSRLLDWRQSTLNPNSGSAAILKLQHSMAIAYINIERIPQAIEILEHAVENRRLLAESNDALLLELQIELADAYRRNSIPSRSIQMLETIDDFWFHTRHPLASHAAYMLGMAYLADGNPEKAIQQQKHAIELRQDLNKYHPDKLRLLFELARAHHVDQQYEEAVKIQRRAVGLAQRSPARNEIELLDQEYNLAFYLRDCKQHAEAVSLLEAVVSNYQSITDDNNADRVSAEATLKLFLQELNQPSNGSGSRLEQVSEREELPIDEHQETMAEAVEPQAEATGATIDLEDGTVNQSPLMTADEPPRSHQTLQASTDPPSKSKKLSMHRLKSSIKHLRMLSVSKSQ